MELTQQAQFCFQQRLTLIKNKTAELKLAYPTKNIAASFLRRLCGQCATFSRYYRVRV